MTDSGSGIRNNNYVFIDLDANGDGDFTDMSDMMVYAMSVVSDGLCEFELSTDLADGTYGFRARSSDAAGNSGTSEEAFVTISVGPRTIISDPSATLTSNESVSYTVTFEDVNFAESALTADDVVLNATGTADGTVSIEGSGTSYTITISNITGDGTLGISIPAGAAHDDSDNLSLAATSDTFTVDNTAPTVTIDQADDQADPSANMIAYFTVVFSEAVSDFDAGDVTLDGTATGTLLVAVASVGFDRTTYTVTVTGITAEGTVIAAIAADARPRRSRKRQCGVDQYGQHRDLRRGQLQAYCRHDSPRYGG